MKMLKIISAIFWMLVEIVMVSGVLHSWSAQGAEHLWAGVLWFSVPAIAGYCLTMIAINKNEKK